LIEDLPVGEAHIWFLRPDRVTEKYEAILSAEEKKRQAAFRFERDRRTHVLTRAFVRTLLSRYADVAPAAWQFSENHYGKPEISGPRDAPLINFNLSHTDGLIAGIFAREAAVGIDVERIRDFPDALEIAGRHFSPEECLDLERRAGTGRDERFFEFWTLKEACIKARGLGVSLDLTRFTFRFSNDAISIAFEAGETEDPAVWQFRLYRPGDRHVLAAAVNSQEPVKFRIRDAHEQF
jgi:4'-phosphopantetheinyl transferase